MEFSRLSVVSPELVVPDWVVLVMALVRAPVLPVDEVPVITPPVEVTVLLLVEPEF
jgi:hypothetical protein